MIGWVKIRKAFLGWKTKAYYAVYAPCKKILHLYVSIDYYDQKPKMMMEIVKVEPHHAIPFGFCIFTAQRQKLYLMLYSQDEYEQWLDVFLQDHLVERSPNQGVDHIRTQRFYSEESHDLHPEPLPSFLGSEISPRQDNQDQHERVSEKSSIYLYVPTSSSPFGMTEADLVNAETQLEVLCRKQGVSRPDRGNFEVRKMQWRQGKPNYALLDLAYLQGRRQCHPQNSWENRVETLMKRWEMEITHVTDWRSWQTIDPEHFALQANNGPIASAEKIADDGKYKCLFLKTCIGRTWNTQPATRESFQLLFQQYFPTGFPFEVTKVFCGSPQIAFSWRHWGEKVDTETPMSTRSKLVSSAQVELTGFCLMQVDKTMRIQTLQIFYDAEAFVKAIETCVPSRASTEPFVRLSPCADLSEFDMDPQNQAILENIRQRFVDIKKQAQSNLKDPEKSEPVGCPFRSHDARDK